MLLLPYTNDSARPHITFFEKLALTLTGFKSHRTFVGYDGDKDIHFAPSSADSGTVDSRNSNCLERVPQEDKDHIILSMPRSVQERIQLKCYQIHY